MVVKEDVNWTSYFAKIRGVCPWSYAAHMNDNILFIDYSEHTFNTWRILFGSSKHEAFVYKCPGKSVEWLSNKCDQLNQPNQTDQTNQTSEWLWSHPAEGGDSTPVEVLIQQDKQLLEQLREAVGYEEEE